MTQTDSAWISLKDRITELEALGGVVQLLEWDQQTMMPSGGAPHRGLQLATITGLMHDKLSDPAVGEWLSDLSDTTDPICKAAVRNIRRDHSRAGRCPRASLRRLLRRATLGSVTG